MRSACRASRTSPSCRTRREGHGNVAEHHHAHDDPQRQREPRGPPARPRPSWRAPSSRPTMTPGGQLSSFRWARAVSDEPVAPGGRRAPTIANANTALRKKLAAVIVMIARTDRDEHRTAQHVEGLAVQHVGLEVVRRQPDPHRRKNLDQRSGPPVGQEQSSVRLNEHREGTHRKRERGEHAPRSAQAEDRVDRRLVVVFDGTHERPDARRQERSGSWESPPRILRMPTPLCRLGVLPGGSTVAAPVNGSGRPSSSARRCRCAAALRRAAR